MGTIGTALIISTQRLQSLSSRDHSKISLRCSRLSVIAWVESGYNYDSGTKLVTKLFTNKKTFLKMFLK